MKLQCARARRTKAAMKVVPLPLTEISAGKISPTIIISTVFLPELVKYIYSIFYLNRFFI